MDFVRDQLFDGRKARVLSMVDAFTRYSPVIEARFNWRGATVSDVLERAYEDAGYPRTIWGDRGPEFISKDLDLWTYRGGVVLDFSRPRKPTDNAYIVSLNGKLRAECLNVALVHQH